MTIEIPRNALIAAGVIALLALGIAIGIGVSGDGDQEGGGSEVKASHCGRVQYKPTEFVVACGDRGFFIEGISWSSWTSEEAQGLGTGVINSCDPDCIEGDTRTGQIELRLNAPKSCSDGTEIYAHYDYTWTEGVPSTTGQHNTDTGGGEPFPVAGC